MRGWSRSTSPTLPTVIHSTNDLLNLPLYGSQASASGGIGFGSMNNPGPYQQPGFQNYRPDIYVQDTWKISPRLTVNFGLQYERESGLFNSDVPKPHSGASLWFGSFRYASNNIELAPAVGFAFTLNQKTVIRGRWRHLLGQPFPVPALPRSQYDHATRQWPR